MQEMPLLVFTLLEQTAVGAFAALAALRLAGKAGEGKVAFKIGLTVFAMSVVAMGASMFHLGQPLRAVNVLFGMGSSWLSWEILFFGLFAACALVYALLERADKAGAAKAVGVVGAVCGVMAIVSTAICYTQPGVPAWNSAWTPAQFALTAVACGIPLYGALSATFGGAAAKRAGAWWAAFAVLFVTQIAMRWMFFSDIVTLTSTLPTT